METMESVHALVEAVLGAPSSAGFEQAAVRLGRKVQDREARAAVQQLVETGLETGRFSAGNAHMLLFFLDAVACGARSLKLERYLFAQPKDLLLSQEAAPSPECSERGVRGASVLVKALMSSVRRSLRALLPKAKDGREVAGRLIAAIVTSAIHKVEAFVFKQLSTYRLRDTHWRWQARTKIVELLIRRSTARNEQLALWRWKLNARRPNPTRFVLAVQKCLQARICLWFQYWKHTKRHILDRGEKLRKLLKRTALIHFYQRKAALSQLKSAVLGLSAQGSQRKPQGARLLILALSRATRGAVAPVFRALVNTRKPAVRTILKSFRKVLGFQVMKWHIAAKHAAVTAHEARLALTVNALRHSPARFSSAQKSPAARSPGLNSPVLFSPRMNSPGMFSPPLHSPEWNISAVNSRSLSVPENPLKKDNLEILRRTAVRLTYTRERLLITALLLWSGRTNTRRYQLRLAKLAEVLRRASQGLGQAWQRLAKMIQMKHKEASANSIAVLKLRLLLETLLRPHLYRVLEHATTTVPVSRALHRLSRICRHAAKAALHRWKLAVLKRREREAHLQVKGTRLNSALERATRRWLQLDLITNKRTVGKRMGWRLQKAMANLAKRSLRTVLYKIRGNRESVRRVLRSAFDSNRGRARQVLRFWRTAGKSVLSRKEASRRTAVLLAVALKKAANVRLLKALNQVAKSPRVIKLAVSALSRLAAKKPSDSFHRWRESVDRKRGSVRMWQAVKFVSLLLKSAERTRKEALNRVASKALKAKAAISLLFAHVARRAQPALQLWHQRVTATELQQSRHASGLHRLQNTLSAVTRSVMRKPYVRLASSRVMVRSALGDLAQLGKLMERRSISRWRDAVFIRREKAVERRAKGERLQLIFSLLLRRTLNSAFIPRSVSRLKTALRMLFLSSKWGQQRLLLHWRILTAQKVLAQQSQRLKGLRLAVRLERVGRKVLRYTWVKNTIGLPAAQRADYILRGLPKRIIREVFKVVIAKNSHVKNRVAELRRILLAAPISAMSRWRDFAQRTTANSTLKALSAEKLRFHLALVPVNHLKSAFGALARRQQILLKTLQAISRMSRAKVLSELMAWKAQTLAARQRILFNVYVIQRMQSTLLRVPARTINAVFHLVMAKPAKTKGALRAVERSLLRGPRCALTKWRAFSWDLQQAEVVKALHAQQLRNALEHVPARTLNDAFLSIKHDFRKVKAAIGKIVGKMEVNAKEGLRKWRLKVEAARFHAFVAALRGRRIQRSVLRIAQRYLAFALRKVTTGRTQAALALRSALLSFQKGLSGTLQTWNRGMQSRRALELLQTIGSVKSRQMQVEHLRRICVHLCQRSTRLAFGRILGMWRVRAAIRSLISSLRDRLRSGLQQWKRNICRLD